ncbi:hypothetical protein A2400_01270 [candidate division WS6 bacterium RIFOXYB1_FULL_33_14]|uniref:SH3b domain-containing protein n=1 Tax=candidate division WS6 bacterium RIFOXYB1_FULL_33_14 TaxID=1817896 RepID=A0A1F4UFG7_9BACT|nr:MAG: hypothetical protein A2400_01270 [candidate division WS6 bacterium RIFOXYB1_FULL_33_14]
MKCLKYLTVLLLAMLIVSFLRADVSAIEVIAREEISIDESLSEEIDIFSSPQKIYISQIRGFNSELSNNSKEWVQLLYYQSITRLNLNDIPFNYLIDQSGNIYEGARGGVGVNPGLEGGENVILIGIMDDRATLSPRTYSSLKEFVEDLSYKYGIKEGNWDFIDLKLKNSEEGFSYLVPIQSKNPLKQSISTFFKEIEWSSKEHLDYKSSIVSVDYEKEVVIGDTLQVKVSVKNENDFAWFTSPNYIYVSTKDSKESIHAINSEWESFSKPTYIKEEVVKAGDTVEILFEMLAKSKPGKYKESFYLMKSSDIVVDASSFDVEFSIVKGSNKIIEIVSPEYGFVNIRECKWYSCKKVEVANEGDVFITTKKEDGWYEIVYGDNKKGWIYQKYAREL